ncbi:hypothetical protein MGLY_31180 [Neomoorella glycerini]|uniref:2,3-diketo-L-gulonate-binding periplasmic protein YiaO n=1 Tax=Neomoorella glycerini TaxID=55779 RepID=A0A6I5ZV82_9FIRM|nr:TRAP transporter substrate-binding protein [Moorella glycerini]QGP93696.1 hypothetical protein MGLY_31180 [Moorella glycerini]
MRKFSKGYFKKFVFLALMVIVTLLVAACGGGKQVSDQKASDNNKQTSSDKIVLRLAHNQMPDQGYGLGVAKFVDLVRQKTNGKVEIQVFDQGKLGDERDVTEGLNLGTVDMAITSIGVMTNYNPELSAIVMPFIFRDYDHVEKVMGSGILNPALEKLQSKGMKALAIYAQGFRDVATREKPIKSLEDFRGVKIRIPAGEVYTETFKALGANPTPIPWGELYTSLQTKVVDGYENNPQVANQIKLYEVTKYLSLTNHIWEGGIVLIAKNKWDQLPADIQRAIQEAATESAKIQRDLIRKGDDKAIEVMKQNKMEVVNIDRTPLIAAVKPVYEQLGKKYGIEQLLKQIQEVK